MPSGDIDQLHPFWISLLPTSQQRELKDQLTKIRELYALAEVASTEQADALQRFATKLAAAIDQVERSVAPLERLNEAQRRELDAQIDLVLEHNRELLDHAQAYAVQAARDIANRPTGKESSAVEQFLIGFSGGEENYNALRKVFGR